jgi:biotin transporter BioY
MKILSYNFVLIQSCVGMLLASMTSHFGFLMAFLIISIITMFLYDKKRTKELGRNRKRFPILQYIIIAFYLFSGIVSFQLFLCAAHGVEMDMTSFILFVIYSLLGCILIVSIRMIIALYYDI